MEIITAIATVPAILALVNWAKQFGVHGRWSTLLAVVLGVLASLAEWSVAPDPGSSLAQAAVSGLALGLSASGLYDVSAAVARPAVSTTPALVSEASFTVAADPAIEGVLGLPDETEAR